MDTIMFLKMFIFERIQYKRNFKICDLNNYMGLGKFKSKLRLNLTRLKYFKNRSNVLTWKRIEILTNSLF
jgi:hypothetical protein